MSSPAPVYVAGLERSGTSLMYALLASHPSIAMTRRTNLWTYFYERYGDLREPSNLDACLDVMRRYKRLVVLEVDWERLRSEFMRSDRTYPELFALLHGQVAERMGRSRWGDKSLNTEKYTPAIVSAYPDVRIVHMLRDPRDRFASVIARWKVRRGGVGAGIGEWMGSARLAERFQRDYPLNYRVVRYEDLVTQPEEVLRDLCSFLGEPYSDRMLEMDGAASFRDQGSNSSYGQREAGVISADSIGKYRSVLSLGQAKFIEHIGGDLMEHFGYPLDRPELDRGAVVGYITVTRPVETVRFRAWQVQQARRDRVGRVVPSYRLVESGDRT